MLNILLIDDNPESITSLFNGLCSVSNSNIYKIINICNTEQALVECIEYNKIDLILLNLEIKKIHAYKILELLEKINPLYKIIIFSSSPTLDFKYVKFSNRFLDAFSFPIDFDILTKLIDDLNNSLEKNEDSNSKNIEDILNTFNFTKSNVGYLYILDFLNICIKNCYKTIPKMALIYDEIAKIHKLSSARTIDWNIQTSINNMRKYTAPSVLNEYFTFSPSTKVFLNKILSIYYIKNRVQI